MEAITREEKIMSGENLTPITRKEMFLAKAAGQDVETPTPITREEMFLSNISGGGSSIEIQPLSITENGTYTAPEGTAYSPIDVNVASSGGGENKLAKLVDKSITEVTAADLEGVTQIGREAFHGCKALTSITIPNSVTKISYNAFYDCDGLRSMTIPPSITVIENDAFKEINGSNISLYISDLESWCNIQFGGKFTSNPSKIAKNIYINGLIVTEIVLPDTVTTVKNNVFCYFKANRIILHNKVTSIGNYSFAYCSNLTNIEIPNNVTSIGDQAFYYTGLTSIDIPENITTIGSLAFGYCNQLERVKVRATTPPAIQSNTFSYGSKTCIYEIPASAYETYKSATNWSTLNIVASEEF